MQTLWNLLTEPATNKHVRWFATSEANNLGGIAHSPQSLESVARLSHVGYNCYVTLNPTNTRPTKRINQNDVTHWAFLLLDLDPLDKNADVNDAIGWLDYDLTPYGGIDLVPTILRSGRGVQGWLRFAPREIDSEEQRRYFVGVNRGFLKTMRRNIPKGWRLDMTSDLARIARMPGSLHQTTGIQAEIECFGRMQTKLETDRFIKQYYEPIPLQSFESDGTEKEWFEVQEELTFAAKNFILMGALEGERHRTCQHTCKTLQERGVSKMSAFEALMLGNEACKSPLAEREVRGILEQVYKKETV